MEPPLNRRRLVIEMIMHTVFLTLILFSCINKRSIDDAFRLYQALQIVFIDEAFGDFNEKTFMVCLPADMDPGPLRDRG